MTDKEEKVIKYLKQAFYIEKKVNALIELKSKNQSLACKCTASYQKDNVQNKSDENNIEKVIHKIIDIDYQITSEIDKLVDIKADILKSIKQLNNPDYESVLINRYLNFYTIEKTAEIMHYSITAVNRKHNAAIKKMIQNDIV